ncbi:hypothetical protein ACIOD2_46670 [Amycolatopsis sp. NPDC088138]|uniref:hypothetical protein n=1 Tax=Amycolatopsis sp. NPDC088138 TaxID=3363938 RepID=UPI00381ABEF5
MAATAAAAFLAVAPTASATMKFPPGPWVEVYHSSGTLVGRLHGDMNWSASLRTVTFSPQDFYVRAGECVYVVYGGYQNNNLVAKSPKYKECGRDGAWSAKSISTDTPGGIQTVIIELTDVEHGNKASNNCWYGDLQCTDGP